MIFEFDFVSDNGQQPGKQESSGERRDVERIHSEDEGFRKENFLSQSRHREF